MSKVCLESCCCCCCRFFICFYHMLFCCCHDTIYHRCYHHSCPRPRCRHHPSNHPTPNQCCLPSPLPSGGATQHPTAIPQGIPCTPRCTHSAHGHPHAHAGTQESRGIGTGGWLLSGDAPVPKVRMSIEEWQFQSCGQNVHHTTHRMLLEA